MWKSKKRKRHRRKHYYTYEEITKIFRHKGILETLNRIDGEKIVFFDRMKPKKWMTYRDNCINELKCPICNQEINVYQVNGTWHFKWYGHDYHCREVFNFIHKRQYQRLRLEKSKQSLQKSVKRNKEYKQKAIVLKKQSACKTIYQHDHDPVIQEDPEALGAEYIEDFIGVHCEKLEKEKKKR